MPSALELLKARLAKSKSSEVPKPKPEKKEEKKEEEVDLSDLAPLSSYISEKTTLSKKISKQFTTEEDAKNEEYLRRMSERDLREWISSHSPQLSDYRRKEEEAIFLALCQLRLRRPRLSGLSFSRMVQWLCPSFHLSNGRRITEYSLRFTQAMLKFHPPSDPIDLHYLWLSIADLELMASGECLGKLVEWLEIEAQEKSHLTKTPV